MSDPQLVVRVAANLAEMKANLAEGVSQVETYASALKNAASAYDGSRIIAQASAAAAAIQSAGGVTALTSAEMVKANAIFTQAAEKLTLMGQSGTYAGKTFSDLAAQTKQAEDSGHSMGQSWILRIAEGQLLRDAVREVLSALKDMVEFLPEMAMKGSVVADVEQAFQHLSTEAGHTSEVLLGTLRAGVHGTVDDFTLMQRANKDMAAGLNLTDAQFGTLAQGARALAKATGTDTTQALDAMSDAMVTGRTKAIALLTGKVDLKAAEEAFAVSLGGTGKELTAEGKLEADREAILKAVATGLARVGDQHDSLKDKVQQDQAAWSNLEDAFAKGVATSPVLAAGFDSIHKSLAAAFGPNQTSQVNGLVGVVNNLAIKVVDVGIGAGLIAGEFVQAWAAIKIPILAVEQVVVALTADLVTLVEKVVGMAASMPGVGDQFKNLAATTADWGLQARAMAADLHQQVIEAHEGMLGHSALSQTIDKGVGSLLNMRDAMIAASAANAAGVKPLQDVAGATDKAGEAAKNHGVYLQQTAEEIKKTAALATKSVEEWLKLVHQADTLEIDLTGTKYDAEEARIRQHYADLETTLRANGTFTEAIGRQMAINMGLDLDKIKYDWQAVRDTSIESLQETFQHAQATYDAMTSGSQHHSAATIQHFRDLRDAARDALHETAAEHQATFEHMRDDVDRTSDSYQAWLANVATDADKAALALEGVKKKADDARAAAEAANEALIRSRSSTQDLPVLRQGDLDRTIGGHDTETIQRAILKIEQGYAANPGRRSGGNGSTGVMAGDEAGWEQLNAERTLYAQLQAALANLPKFAGGVENASGGMAMVGERGPEIMYVPPGANIYPTGTGPAGGTTVNLTIQVTQPLGTPDAIGRAVMPGIISALRSTGVRLPTGV